MTARALSMGSRAYRRRKGEEHKAIQSMLNRIILSLIVAFLLSISALGTVALAADEGKPIETSGSSSIQDILKDDSLKGNSTTQMKITAKVGWIFSFLITVIGFLIIMFTILKFFLTILYLTFPTIFDSIDSYQRESLSIDLKNAGAKNIIAYVFALVLPNIKSLTDYANGEGDMNVDPWSYIKKRGPQILGFVVLGCMIYDGLSRDFIAKAADVSLYIGKRVEGTDSIAAIKKLLDDGEDYAYFYDENTTSGKNLMKIAESADAALRSINPNRISTTYYKAVGDFVTSDVIPRITERIQTASGFAIDGVKSFTIKAEIQTSAPSTDNVNYVEVIEVPQESEIMTTINSPRYLVISVTNIVKLEDAVAEMGEGAVGDPSHYPRIDLWSPTGRGMSIDVGSTGNTITKGLSDSKKATVTVELSDQKITLTNVPVVITDSEIEVNFFGVENSGGQSVNSTSDIIRLSVTITGLEFTPDKGNAKAENWYYGSGRNTFIYNTH